MPRKSDPRNQGLKGNDLIRFKYNYLISKGVAPAEAKSLRKNKWDKIDAAIKIKKRGGQLAVKDYYKTKGKSKAGKKQKAAAKQKVQTAYPKNNLPAPPPGYHYAYYKKSGKYILKKNPEKKIKEIIKVYPKILVFYQEVVETTDGESVMSHLRKMKNRSLNYLKTEINGGKYGSGWMSQNGMYIGRVRVEIAEDEKEEERLLRKYAGWAVLYNAPPEPMQLLAVIATIGKYVYEPERKESAVDTLISTAHVIDPEAGKEIDRLIG